MNCGEWTPKAEKERTVLSVGGASIRTALQTAGLHIKDGSVNRQEKSTTL